MLDFYSYTPIDTQPELNYPRNFDTFQRDTVSNDVPEAQPLEYMGTMCLCDDVWVHRPKHECDMGD